MAAAVMDRDAGAFVASASVVSNCNSAGGVVAIVGMVSTGTVLTEAGVVSEAGAAVVTVVLSTSTYVVSKLVIAPLPMSAVVFVVVVAEEGELVVVATVIVIAVSKGGDSVLVVVLVDEVVELGRAVAQVAGTVVCIVDSMIVTVVVEFVETDS